jgi:poly(3-hydroxyalkanoate) synthetase
VIPFPLQLSPEDTVRELVELNRKIVRGIESLSRIRDKDIQVGVSAKEEVYREDNVVLYRYTPLVKQPFQVPILIVYALVNRPYMVDLQEDRSLVRNLLKLGMDVYLIDWGYPGRGDRWLTLDDYINGYINNCVDVLRARHGLDRINLLGICQGGTFSLCYSALYPEKVQNLVTMVTITATFAGAIGFFVDQRHPPPADSAFVVDVTDALRRAAQAGRHGARQELDVVLDAVPYADQVPQVNRFFVGSVEAAVVRETDPQARLRLRGR